MRQLTLSLLVVLSYFAISSPVLRAAVSDSTPDAVVLSDQTTIEALDEEGFKYTHRLKVKVNRPDVLDRFRYQAVYYDDDISIQTLKGKLTDSGSKKPYQSNKKAVSDRSVYDGFSVVTSGRYKLLQMPVPKRYPAVYEYTVVYLAKAAIALPTVTFLHGSRVSVEQASLTLVDPANKFNHLVVDERGIIEQQNLGEGRTRFCVSDITTADEEDYLAPVVRAGPAVLLSPKQGRLETSYGNFDTWDGIAAWTSELLRRSGTLPEHAKQEARKLVRGISDPRERVHRIYEYMQARTHYVSIQLGIGGFQPMPPAEVHEQGYGDCKALSNYTRLLLEAINIPARYCVIGAGDREILYPNFASVSQANHVVLAVPMGKDTMWLECTDQQNPTDHMSSWTAGRYALLVEGDAGNLVRVTGLRPAENQFSTSTHVDFDEQGVARFQRQTHLSGAAIEWADGLSRADQTQRHVLAQERYAVPLTDYEVSVSVTDKAGIPSATVTESGTTRSWAQTIASRLIIPTYGLAKQPESPRRLHQRIEPIFFNRTYRTSDTLTYTWPNGKGVGTSPRPASFAAPHASYELETLPSDSKQLRILRSMQIKRGMYPASDAPAIEKFYEDVRRADSSVLIIKEVPDEP